MSTSPANAQLKRDLKIRTQHFPGADALIFDKGQKGYVPLPIVLRKAMRYLSLPEARVLVYLMTRCSAAMVCFPGIDEIVHELGLKGTKNLKPHLRTLETKKFISTKTKAGKTYFLVHDPAIGIANLVKIGTISPEELGEINELLEVLKRDPIKASPGQP